EEIELEDCLDQDQPEHAQRGPQQPLLERHKRRVAVVATCLDVVQDDRDHQQRGRSDRDRVEQVLEDDGVEALTERGLEDVAASHGRQDSRARSDSAPDSVYSPPPPRPLPWGVRLHRGRTTTACEPCSRSRTVTGSPTLRATCSTLAPRSSRPTEPA